MYGHIPQESVQGGLEIPVKVIFSWSDKKSMTILKKNVKSMNYSGDDMVYFVDSKKISKGRA